MNCLSAAATAAVLGGVAGALVYLDEIDDTLVRHELLLDEMPGKFGKEFQAAVAPITTELKGLNERMDREYVLTNDRLGSIEQGLREREAPAK